MKKIVALLVFVLASISLWAQTYEIFSCAEQDKCPLQVSLTRTPNSSSYEYSVSVYVDDNLFATLSLEPSKSRLDTTLLFCTGRRVAIWANNGGENFTMAVTDAFGHVTESSYYPSYSSLDVCSQQCELVLEIGASSLPDNGEYSTWIELYAGNEELPFYSFNHYNYGWWGGSETLSIPVSAGVPLRVVWHEPDVENHSSWFSLYDPSQQRIVAEKWSYNILSDGEIATYTPDCGASCTGENRCPLQISLTRTLQSTDYEYTAEVMVDNYPYAMLSLDPYQERLDTTLLFCPGRRVDVWAEQDGEDFFHSVTDAFGNVTEGYGYSGSFHSFDACTQQCELVLEIGANYIESNGEYSTWLEFYVGDDEYPFYDFGDYGWWGGSETLSIPVSAGVPLRVVWHEPDVENHSSWFSLYDPSQQQIVAEKWSYNILSDGEIATYTPDCGASCTEEDKCPLQISLTRTLQSTDYEYTAEVMVDNYPYAMLSLDPYQERLDTTLLFCPGRRVHVLTGQGGEDFFHSVTDAFGNVTEGYGYSGSFHTFDACTQQCELVLEIGVNYIESNGEYSTWLEFYVGDDEYPFYDFGDYGWWGGSDRVSIPVSAGVPLRVVWHEPDTVNYSSWFTLYDQSQQRMIASKYGGEIINDGEITTYTPDCGASCMDENRCPLQISLTRTPNSSSNEYSVSVYVDDYPFTTLSLEPSESRLDTTLLFCTGRRVAIWANNGGEDFTMTVTDANGNVTEDNGYVYYDNANVCADTTEVIPDSVQIVYVTTNPITNITVNSAVCGGAFSSEYPILAFGVCWSTSPTPTLADSYTVDGGGTGSFVSTLNGLEESTTYYVRAYVTNETGTYYGEEIIFTTMAASQDYHGIIYVTQTGAGSRSGDSWENAVSSIADAQTLAVAHNAVVWVAAGTYYGSTTSANAFIMMDGVSMYGSFSGNEPADYDLSQRNFEANATILDGQNSRRVVYQSNSFNTRTTLDGFTIRNGYTTESGGGAYLRHNTALSNCRFVNNESQYSGGGLYFYGSNNSDTIRGCLFEHNTARSSSGGGVVVRYAAIINSKIANNTSNNSGGGLYLDHANVINGLIANNLCDYGGGGIYSSGRDTIANSTIVRNSSGDNGGGIYASGTTTLVNSVVWGNQGNSEVSNIANENYVSCSYSAVEGGFLSGSHVINLSSDNFGDVNNVNYPWFVSPDNGDFRLYENSCLINAGTNSVDIPAWDLANETRVYGDTVDIGCYEFHGEVNCVPPVSFVAQDVTGSSAMLTWQNHNGDGSSYCELSYKKTEDAEWIVVDSIPTNYLMLSGLQQKTSYLARVRTVCDMNTFSYYSDTLHFNTNCYSGEQSVTIGETTTDSYGYLLPFYPPYSYTQQIYMVSELGSARSIDSIGFQYYNNTAQTRNVNIYLGHTQKTSFYGSNDWVPLSDLTLVYSGELAFNNSGNNYWFKIPLTTVFEYNGTDNLILAFDDNTGSYSSYNYNFYTHSFTGYSNSSMYSYSSGTNIDPLSPPSGDRISYRNNIWFSILCSENTCDQTNVSAVEITDHSAKLVCSLGEGADSYELEFGEVGDDVYTVLSTTDNACMLTGLRQNTQYVARVRSLCSDSLSHWKYTYFTTDVANYDRLYVTTTGEGNGDTWETACNDLNWAMETATRIQGKFGTYPDIWVSAGTYYGDTLSSEAFTMHEGVSMYGGFAGNEPVDYDLSLRDFAVNVTILDGQNSRRVVNQPNSFNILTALDGFTIQNGYTTGSGGGAILQHNTALSNCHFVNNESRSNGGGLYFYGMYGSYDTIKKCSFEHNTASSSGGGVHVSYATIINSLIANNSCNYGGGGIYSSNGNTIANSTIVRNSSGDSGGGIYASGTTTMVNSVVWGNQWNSAISNVANENNITSSYSAVEGGISGHHNIPLFASNDLVEFSPYFVNPSVLAGAADLTENVDWHLQANSLCINRGNNGGALGSVDLDGNLRIQRDSVDMGCYESEYEIVAMPVYDGIIYVTETGAGTKKGDSWENAMSSVGDAIAVAICYNAKVWVASGVYYGDTLSSDAFTMRDGGSIYGGFAGNEPADYDLSQRDFAANATILDGQHSRRVVYQPRSFNTRTVLDGFTIQNGYTTGDGGGAYLQHNIALSNCRFVNNESQGEGGGLCIYGSYNSYDTIKECSFEHNITRRYGGGVYLSRATIINSLIANNSCNYGGGGMYLYDANVINGLIANNSSNDAGGGIYNNYNSSITNSTIVRNSSGNRGGGIYASGSTTLANSVVWGNRWNSEVSNIANENYVSCSYSAVEGGFLSGSHVINLRSDNFGDVDNVFYPWFVSPDNGDFRLYEKSCLINAGTNSVSIPALDLANETRVYDDTVDIGCYEFHGETYCLSPVSFAAQDVTGSSAMLTWQSHNMDGSSYCELSYKKTEDAEWIVVDSISTNYLMLSGLQQKTPYLARVRTVCDMNVFSDYSETLHFNTNCYSGEQPVTIGETTTNSYGYLLPFNSESLYSYTQQIYMASEMGSARSIDSIGFQYYNNTAQTRNVNIYLGHTQKTSFSGSNDWVPLSDLTLVYSGELAFNNSGNNYWFKIPLTTVFEYNGTDNLILAFDDNTGSYAYYYNFYTHSITSYSNSSMYSYSSGTNIDPLSPSSGNRASYRNNIWFSILCSENTCDQTNVSAVEITDHSAKLVCSLGEGVDGYELEFGEVGDDVYTVLTTTDNTCMLTGLRQNTQYVARVRSLCGDNQSLWKYTYFTTDVANYDRLYVTTTGEGNGDTWATACGDLNWAMETAIRIQGKYGTYPDIWVSAGVYYGDTLLSNTITMRMREGVSVYGGFAGNEPADYDLSLRDFAANATILDGQHRRRVVYQHNSFNTCTALDGFTIQNGYTTGNGGGAYLQHNTALSNCHFVNNESQNSGGGLYFNNSNNSDTIIGCLFEHNTASSGGGVYVSNANVINCQITNNTSNSGGGMYVIYAKVINSLIANNSSSAYGGGIYSSNGSMFKNSTIVRNSSGNSGGGIYVSGGNYSSSTTIVNSVVWGNRWNSAVNNIANENYVSCSYSAVEGGISGNHNIPLTAYNELDAFSPYFVNPSVLAGAADLTENVDWRLQVNSPCINRGNNSSAFGSVDLAGSVRIQQDCVDMGCYESEYTGIVLPVYDSIIYVTQTGAGTKTGVNWENAMSSVENAIAVATCYNAKVWVASGVYYGDTLSSDAITMRDGVSLYGGFAGNEPAGYDLSLRDFAANATILDGQHSRRVVNQPNSFNNRTVLDGFTIQNGYSTSNGGGAYLQHNTALSNCHFVNNESQGYGGGLYFYGSYDTIRYCSFEHNIAGSYGGGMYLYYANVINSLIANNSCNYGGGGIYNSSGNNTIANSTIVRNSSGNSGGGIYASGTTTMVNSVVWGNRWNSAVSNVANENNISCSYSAVEGGVSGHHNIPLTAYNELDAFSPYFVNPSVLAGAADLTANVDWRLQSNSPCINRGNNSSVLGSVDLAGSVRIQQDCVDMGCYESEYAGVVLPVYDSIIYVTQTGTGTKTGEDWENAMSSVEDAIAVATCYNAKVWVASGVYYGDILSSDAFTMHDGVSVYGGFAGNEPADYDLSLRDFTANATILDGQHSRRVINQPYSFNTLTALDGFTVRNGYTTSSGGGAYLRHNIALSNCRFVNNESQNSGGGLYIDGSNNSDTIRGCSFEHNIAGSNGGGLYVSYATIINSKIANNTSNSYGGGMYISYSANIVNSLIANNSSSYSGGGIYYPYSSSYGYNCSIVNSTIVRNNSGNNGGGIYTSGTMTLVNSVVWGNRRNSNLSNIYNGNTYNVNNVSCSYSAVEGGFTNGENVINLSSDNIGDVNNVNYPWFVSPDNGDFRLYENSCLINAGTNSVDIPAWDLANETRVYGDTVDIGCYEFHGEVNCVPPVSFVAQDVTGSSAMLTWQNHNGDGSSYCELSYKKTEDAEWIVVDSIPTDYLMLSGLQQKTSYLARVRTVCDMNTFSYYSETLHFNTSCYIGEQSVTIGETTTNSYGYLLPFYPSYSYTQQIYMASELGSARSIDSIGFQYYNNTAQIRNVNIYLGHTQKTEFSGSNDWVPLSDLTLVYSGELAFNNSGNNYWFKIPLTTVFEYNGTDNLILAFDNTGPYVSYYSYNFYTHSITGYSSMYSYSSGTNIDPLSPPSGNRISYRNNIWFSRLCAESTCDQTNVSAVEITDHSAKLVCSLGEGADSYELEFGEVGDDVYTVLSTTDNACMLTGLRQNTQYVARVRSLCSDSLSHWKYTYFTTDVANYDRLYVTTTGEGNGDTWATACNDLNWAMETATRIQGKFGTYPDIWVAAGVYYGDTLSSDAFTMHEGVNVYGGFAGNEPADYDLSLRDFAANATILDGQNSRRVVNQPNSFNILTALDGFTIQNGYTTGNGGGANLQHNTALCNCRFVNNESQGYGGGLYFNGSYDSYDTIRYCSFEHNIAGSYGGGVRVSYATIINSLIVNNSSNYGGGVYLYSNAKVINSLIANNNSSAYGGGIYSSNGSTIKNSTIVRNSSGNRGGGIYASGTTTMVNSVVWGNQWNSAISNVANENNITSSYSAVEGGISGHHNIPLAAFNELDVFSPYFVNPSVLAGAADSTVNADWHLQANSPCINRGNNSSAFGSVDLDGNSRIQQDSVDMGCYESEYVGVVLPVYDSIIYVTQTGAGTKTGENWANAMSSIEGAMAVAICYNAKVWVAAGIYYGDTSSSNAFTMRDGVSVYGSFAGNEPADYDLSQRDFAANATILDGQNSRRVVNQPNAFDIRTVLDGFTIQNGYTTNDGGGAYLRHNTALSNCHFANNVSQSYGGGLCYIGSNNSYDTIRECSFENNIAEYYGGLYVNYASVINSQIANNSSNNFGGGVYVYFANIINSLVANNTSNYGGGGIYSYGSTIVNSTIVRNKSGDSGGGIYASGTTTLVNSVVWGNLYNSAVSNIANENYISCSYSAVEGGISGHHNIPLAAFNELDVFSPYFVNPSVLAGAADSTVNADWHLQANSPCINRGYNSSVYGSVDLDGNLRIQQDNVDMGCYESEYVGVVLPVYDSIIYVTQTGAGTRTGENWENAMSSVENAIAAATCYNAKVWVAAGVYYGDTLSSNAITMREGLSLYGGFAGNEPADYDLSQRDFDVNTTILDGQHSRRVVNQPNSFNTLTALDGFTIQNGYTTGSGGGAYLRHNLALSNCRFVNNESLYSGGGLYFNGSNNSDTIRGCSFENNIARSSGGGGYINYASIDNCLIVNNTSSYSGGGLYASNSTITNCVIMGNSTTSYNNYNYSSSGGGGLYVSSSTVTACRITNNTAYYYGGGIYASSSAISNTELLNNISRQNGGGVYASSGSVLSCRISYNQASYSAGGIRISGTQVRNCLVSNNTAGRTSSGYVGGGIQGTGTIVNTTIVRNSATGSGAGVNGNSSTKLWNSIVWGNKNNGVSDNLNGSSIVCSYSAVEGGYPGTEMVLLDGNNSPMFVNATLIAGASDSTENADWHLLDGSVCINNGSNALGTDDFDLDGTARIKRDTVDLGCYESNSYSVSPVDYAGIIYVKPGGSGTQLGDSWENAAASISDAQILALAYNAVVWVASGVYYGTTVFSNAFTMRDGVSVYGGFAGNEPADYDLSQRDFETNATILDGQNARRVLYQPFAFNAQTVWDGFVIQNGYVVGNGAGAYIQKNAILRNCIVTDNLVANGSGGGVYSTNGKLEDCVFRNNTVMGGSSYNGGGAYASSSTIANCRFMENNAYNGGGLWATGSSVSNCFVSGNMARNQGGGVFANYNCQLTRCEIIGNSAGYGGGIFSSNNYLNTSNTFNHCKLSNNSASNGGGMYGSYVNVQNCLVSNNTATSNGGGLTLNATSLLKNTTIVRNFSGEDGSGVYGGNNLTLSNCIVWGNQRNGMTNNLNGSSINCNYCAIEDGYPGVNNILIGTGTQYSSDFIYPSIIAGASDTTDNVDWHLLRTSICINHGNNEFVEDSLDLDGTARVKCDTVDLGCYESNYYSVPMIDYDSIIYVTTTGAGTQTGESWANAIASIEEAQAIAQIHHAVVWVAAGTYYGDVMSSNAFKMRDGVNVYGGFAGDEPADYDLSLRDFEDNNTVLDGQNERRVLYQPFEFNVETRWNGFTVQHGKTSGDGAGVYMKRNGHLSECRIVDNVSANNGGGVYCANATVDNCFVSGNTTANSGGGIYSVSGSTVTDCIINNNATTDSRGASYGGGGIYSSYASISNCTIINNSSASVGGGAYTYGTRISQCDINYNVSNSDGGGVYSYYWITVFSAYVDPTIITHSRICNNQAGGNGGGIRMGYYSDRLFNSLVSNNTSANQGGGILGKGDIINATIVRNLSHDVGAGVNGDFNLKNSILWGNEKLGVPDNFAGSNISCTYSAIENGYIGEGNLTLDHSNSETNSSPYFVSPTIGVGADFYNGDWHLLPQSVCINTGSPDTTILSATDLDGYSRVHQHRVDIGCYEYHADSIHNAVTVTVISDNNLRGNAMGSGTYNVGDTVMIYAIPSQYAGFHHWNDNDTTNPRYVIVETDTTFIASFELYLPELHVTSISHSNLVRGDSASISWTVRNDGKAPTPNGEVWYDRVWLSLEPKVAMGNVSPILLGTFPSISSLDTGDYYTQRQTVNIPLQITDDYYLFVITDAYDADQIFWENGVEIPYEPPTYLGALSYNCGGNNCGNNAGNRILEISEYDRYSQYPYYHDNFFYKQVQIHNPSLPDLEAVRVAVASANYPFLNIAEMTHFLLIQSQITQISQNFFSGSDVDLIYQVENRGTYDTRVEYWRDVIFISNHAELDEFAQAVAVVPHNGLLLPDSSYVVSTTVRIPLEMYDTAYFFVYTDYFEQVYEPLRRENNIKRSGSFIIILSPPADLIPQNITADNTVSTGASFNFSYSVHNQGAGDPNNYSWVDRCYLSTSPTALVDEVVIASDNHYNGLAAGESYSVRHSITLPSNISSGTYYLFVHADCQNDVFEYLYDNNNLVGFPQPISVVQPDLQIRTLNVAETLSAGAEAAVSYLLANTGNGAVVNHYINDGFYLSLSPNGTNPIMLPQFNYNTWLNAHDSIVKHRNVLLPSGLQEGYYYIFAQTNINYTLNEANTNNNRSPIKRVYISHRTLPDLVITSVSLPDTIQAGSTMSFTANITNQGEMAALLNNVDFQLLASTGYEEDDDIDCPVENISFSVQSLVPGTNAPATVTAFIPPSVPANLVSFTLVVNPNHTVTESNYSNNEYAISHEVRAYPFDLVTTSISSIDHTVSGEYIPVEWTIQNQGSVPTPLLPMYLHLNLHLVSVQGGTMDQPWYDHVYLSSDSLFDARDIQIGSYTRYQTLLAGGSYTANLNCRIPVAADGDYYVLVVSDATNVTFDCQRTNNVRGWPISITQSTLPDLRMDTLIAISTLTTGETYDIHYAVSNVGEHVTHESRWTDAFYLSRLPNISGALQLGSKFHNSQLEVNTHYTDSIQVTIPNDWVGDGYLIAYTDATNQIVETNTDSNNLFIMPVSVSRPLPCDLIVLPPDFPQSAIAGENANFSWTLRNGGLNVAQGNIKDALYLSTDSVWSSDDILLGSIQYAINLPANSQQQQSLTLPLQGVPTGWYYVIVKTNILNALNEDSYTNNNAVSLTKMQVDYRSLYIDQEEHPQLIPNQTVYYKLQVGPENEHQTLSCKLTALSQNVSNGLYIAFASAPSASHFDWSATIPYKQEQEILIPSLEQGTYYIMAQGQTVDNSPQTVTLLASIIQFEIISVNTDRASNAGSVTTQIIGAKFDTIMDFRLANSNGYLPAEKIFFHNSTETYATFNLRDQETGVYDMVAELPGGIITIKGQAFVVEPGLPAELLCNIIAPASVRLGNTFTVTIEYGNNGSTDLDISGFLLVSSSGFPIAFVSDSLVNNETELTIETGEPNSNPDVIRPGHFGSKSVFVKATHAGNINLRLYPIRRQY